MKLHDMKRKRNYTENERIMVLKCDEKLKQKALRMIDNFIINIEGSDIGMGTQSNLVDGLRRIRSSVNDI